MTPYSYSAAAHTRRHGPQGLWRAIIGLAERHDPPLYRRLMGFPDDLPDLKRLRPPGGNTRPEGVQASFHAQRQDGTLPTTY